MRKLDEKELNGMAVLQEFIGLKQDLKRVERRNKLLQGKTEDLMNSTIHGGNFLIKILDEVVSKLIANYNSVDMNVVQRFLCSLA